VALEDRCYGLIGDPVNWRLLSRTCPLLKIETRTRIAVLMNAAWFDVVIVSSPHIYIIIYTIQIKQCGIHKGSYVFSFQPLSVTTVNTVAS